MEFWMGSDGLHSDLSHGSNALVAATAAAEQQEETLAAPPESTVRSPAKAQEIAEAPRHVQG
eukprot:749156-Amphidinium_carterae.2